MPKRSKRQRASKTNGGKRAKPGTSRGRPTETATLLQRHGAVLLLPNCNASNLGAHEAMDHLATPRVQAELEEAVKDCISRKKGEGGDDSVIFQHLNVGQESTTTDVGDGRRVQVRIKDLKGALQHDTLDALETSWKHLQDVALAFKMTNDTETDPQANRRSLLTLRPNTPQLLITLPGAGDQDLHTDGTPGDADDQQTKIVKQRRGRPQVAAILTLTSPYRTLKVTPYSAETDRVLTTLEDGPRLNTRNWIPHSVLRVAIPHKSVFMFSEDFIHAGAMSTGFNLSMHAFFDDQLNREGKTDNATWSLRANIPPRIWSKFYEKVSKDVIERENMSFPDRIQVVNS